LELELSNSKPVVAHFIYDGDSYFEDLSFSALQKEREINSTFCHIYMGNPDPIVKPFLHKILESVI
jgi:hypothetical protein